jgi:uncharacterized protein YeaO (DUF488 family)
MPTIALKRAYDPAADDDGTRILVERLWPRGVAKDAARIDHWLKDVAPSTGLRKWFDHDPQKWDGFRERYFAELDQHEDAVAVLRELLGAGPVTFVFGSKETRFNNAVALREYLLGGN